MARFEACGGSLIGVCLFMLLLAWPAMRRRTAGLARRRYDDAVAACELAVASPPGPCREKRHQLTRARAARVAVRAPAARLLRRDRPPAA